MKLAIIGTGRWALNITRSLPPGAEITAVTSSRKDLPDLRTDDTLKPAITPPEDAKP